jgi:hypothetical protein
VRGGKTLARLASMFVFLLAIPEFYLHLASWRVVIRTPAINIYHLSFAANLLDHIFRPLTKNQCSILKKNLFQEAWTIT